MRPWTTAIPPSSAAVPMHHKFAIFDKGVILTGIYNWTRGAASNNEENLILSNDRRLLTAFRGEFERLWKLFEANPLH